MEYNSSILTTVAECDKMLQAANTEKSELVARKVLLEIDLTKEGGVTSSLPTLRDQLTAEIASLQTAYDNTAPGDDRDEIDAALQEKKAKLARLKVKSNNHGGIANMGMQREVNDIEKLIESVDELISAVQLRKQDLETPTA